MYQFTVPTLILQDLYDVAETGCLRDVQVKIEHFVNRKNENENGFFSHSDLK